MCVLCDGCNAKQSIIKAKKECGFSTYGDGLDFVSEATAAEACIGQSANDQTITLSQKWDDGDVCLCTVQCWCKLNGYVRGSIVSVEPGKNPRKWGHTLK